MLKITAIAFALILTTFSSPKAERRCEAHSDRALCRVPFAAQEASPADRWRVAVLCCCKTHSGGECCTQVAVCGGKPPGCFCASPSTPATPQLSFALRTPSCIRNP